MNFCRDLWQLPSPGVPSVPGVSQNSDVAPLVAVHQHAGLVPVADIPTDDDEGGEEEEERGMEMRGDDDDDDDACMTRRQSAGIGPEYGVCDDFVFEADAETSDNAGTIRSERTSASSLGPEAQSLVQQILEQESEKASFEERLRTSFQNHHRRSPSRTVYSPYFSPPPGSPHAIPLSPRGGPNRKRPRSERERQSPGSLSPPSSQKRGRYGRPQLEPDRTVQNSPERGDGSFDDDHFHRSSVYRIDSENRPLFSEPPSPAPARGRSRNIGSGLNTDCCSGIGGMGERRQQLMAMAGSARPHDAAVDNPEDAEVWCFGCQWGARGHQPVDNEKIRELVRCFMGMLLGGSTTLENIANIVSHTYRVTIRDPARVLGQWLPDWPPAVVRRHIENMTEPRVVNALMIRRQLSLLTELYEHTMDFDSEDGRPKPNLPVVRAIMQGQKELRELYRQVPKESFGYNETLMADSWTGGSVLVHPARIERRSRGTRTSDNDPANQQQQQDRHDYAGAPVAARAGQVGVRRSAVSVSGEDTGELRGPSNNEELIRRI